MTLKLRPWKLGAASEVFFVSDEAFKIKFNMLVKWCGLVEAIQVKKLSQG